MDHICFNGEIVPGDQPVLLAANRSYRYGDGLFETMKMIKGRISLVSYHFERLLNSCRVLGYPFSSSLLEKIREDIMALCEKNNTARLGRIRLSVFPGNGGLNEGGDQLQYLIESWPLSESANRLNEKGILIDVYRGARKNTDQLSNLKSANFLPYAMAARYAKQNRLDDCLVLNTSGRIADATIANVFLISNRTLITPPLSEGCIDGVMRRYLLEELKNDNRELTVEEKPLNEDDLLLADELFLTNAVQGIKWVGQLRDKKYTSVVTTQIYNQLVQTIFE